MVKVRRPSLSAESEAANSIVCLPVTAGLNHNSAARSSSLSVTVIENGRVGVTSTRKLTDA